MLKQEATSIKKWWFSSTAWLSSTNCLYYYMEKNVNSAFSASNTISTHPLANTDSSQKKRCLIRHLLLQSGSRTYFKRCRLTWATVKKCSNETRRKALWYFPSPVALNVTSTPLGMYIDEQLQGRTPDGEQINDIILQRVIIFSSYRLVESDLVFSLNKWSTWVYALGVNRNFGTDERLKWFKLPDYCNSNNKST